MKPKRLGPTIKEYHEAMKLPDCPKCKGEGLYDLADPEGPSYCQCLNGKKRFEEEERLREILDEKGLIDWSGNDH